MLTKTSVQKEPTLSHFAFIAVLLLGTFTMSISQSSLSTAYPTLMAAFHLSAATIQWLTTGFMLVMCISMPLSPWLLNNLSFKTMFLGALGLFDLGSLIIVLTPLSLGSYGFLVMMLGRVLEAFAVGVLFPSYQTGLLEITPKANRGTTMGIAGLVMGSALACGPIISGIILKYFSWQSLFYFFIIVISLVIILAASGLIKDVIPRKQSQLDWLSVLLPLGLIGLVYVFDLWARSRGNLIINLTTLVISLIFLGCFVYRQFHLAMPLLELRVLKTFNYVLAILLTSISYMALIVVTIIFPLYYQEVLHVSPFISGMSLVPGAVFLSILNLFSGKLADKIGFKPTMLIGMLMIICGWLMASLSLSHLSLLTMIICAAIIEGGNAFVMMPAVTLGANSLPNQLVSHGTAVITTIRQVLGSAGVALATVILTQVSQQQRLLGVNTLTANLKAYFAVCCTMLGIELFGFVLACLIKKR